MFREALAIIMAAFFALAATQIPAFIDAYEQRLGGAVDELGRVIDGYRTDAEAEKLSLEGWILALERGTSDREGRIGHRVRETVERYDQLAKGVVALAQAEWWQRPLVMVQTFDRAIAGRAWETYSLSLVISPPYAGAGLVIGLLLTRLLVLVFGGGDAPPAKRRPRRADPLDDDEPRPRRREPTLGRPSGSQ